jgi:hypothetical protein
MRRSSTCTTPGASPEAWNRARRIAGIMAAAPRRCQNPAETLNDRAPGRAAIQTPSATTTSAISGSRHSAEARPLPV